MRVRPQIMKLARMIGGLPGMLNKLGLPEKARNIFESYWTYISADSTQMSFAVYAYMTYVYLTQRTWIARNRSHEIGMAFDKRIRDMGGDIWYNCEVTQIDVRDGTVYGVELSGGRRAADKKFGWIHPCCSYPISDVTQDVPVLG